MSKPRPASVVLGSSAEPQEEILDRVFFALSDSTRRDIMRRLGAKALLVSEIAGSYPMSVQAVSRHVQVLVRAGLVAQNRSGRISQCRLEVGPLYSAAIWINGYSKYWQAQFDALKTWLTNPEPVVTPRAHKSMVKKRGRRE